MQILIIDDNVTKAQQLGKLIAAQEPGATICYCNNAQDGFRALETQGANLVFLDVVLPLAFDQEAKEEGSLWFIRETHRKLSGTPMPLIVGTTQYAESIAKVQETFRNDLWSIVYVSDQDERWPRQVQQALRFARSNAERLTLSTPGGGQAFDVAIVTALRTPEFSELVDALGGGEQLYLGETGETWLKTRLTRTDGSEVSVIAACADEMGMVAMASLVTRVTITCNPKVLILVGITAGNVDRVGLSDLIIIESTWDCRAGKLTEKGFCADVKSRECSFKLANKCLNLISEAFVVQFWTNSASKVRPQQIGKVHKGAVACSPAVVAIESAFPELEHQRRKILGLEMEAYGCYDAARRLGDLAPQFVCIKSVCDFGDGGKNDQYQQYCAALAATAVVHVISDTRFANSV